MSNNNLSDGMIEAVVRETGSPSLRLVLKQILLNTEQNNVATGQAPLAKIDRTPKPSTPIPGQAGFSVIGSGGTVIVQITNPQNRTTLSPRLQVAQAGNHPNLQNAPLYHQLSTSSNAKFTQNVTTYPPSTQLYYQFTMPGLSLFWRLRSSYDLQNWNAYQIHTTPGSMVPVAAGLNVSASANPNLVLNQTNFAAIDSVAAGAAATVRVYNSISGPLKSWVRMVGGNTSVLPSATILNVPYLSTQYVAYDGQQYQVHQQLPQMFPDSWTPVGRVNVVGSGPVTLPSVKAILSGGTTGFVIGATFVAPNNAGSGLTQIPILTVTDPGGTGAGATIVVTGISGGACTGLQVTNGGNNTYDSNTTVTPSGGVFSGAMGGGGTVGANTGRLYGATN